MRILRALSAIIVLTIFLIPLNVRAAEKVYDVKNDVEYTVRTVPYNSYTTLIFLNVVTDKTAEYRFTVTDPATGKERRCEASITDQSTKALVKMESEYYCTLQKGISYSCVVYFQNDTGKAQDVTVKVRSVTDTFWIDNIQEDIVCKPGDKICLEVGIKGAKDGLAFLWEDDETATGPKREIVVTEPFTTKCKVSRGDSCSTKWFRVSFENHLAASFKGIDSNRTTVPYGSDLELTVDVTGDDISDIEYYSNITKENSKSNKITIKNITDRTDVDCTVYDKYGNMVSLPQLMIFPETGVDVTFKNYLGTDPVYGWDLVGVEPGKENVIEAVVKGKDADKCTFVWRTFGTVLCTGKKLTLSAEDTKLGNVLYFLVTDKNGYESDYMVQLVADNHFSVSPVEKELTVVRGDRLELKADVKGDDLSKTTYSWELDDKPIYTQSKNKLVIENATLSGTYYLYVNDSYGNSGTSFFRVTVVEPTPTPVATATPTATATPKPTVTATPKPTTSVKIDPKDSKSSILAFVERIYTYVLDREPEQEGAEFWTNELYSFHRTGAEVGLQFIFSDEFTSRNLSDKDFVTVLYRTFFGREPEKEGLNYWTSALKNGTMDRVQVADGFIYSQEWADTCASYGIRSGGEIKSSIGIEPSEATLAFVERMYTTAMKRESDKQGKIYWAGELANFRYTGEQVGVMFFLSDEMNGFGLSDDEFVTRLYKTFMDREPEEGGFGFWTVYLADGGSREGAVLGFTRSEEFVNKCIDARILPY